MLDNPMWAALTTRQRAFALGAGNVRRYAPQVAPFAAVADAQVDVDELLAVVAEGEAVYVVGVAPKWRPPWEILDTGVIVQMICAQPVSAGSPPAVAWQPLGERDHPAMLALTAQVYPEFFRERTSELGRYIGVWHEGTLAAMAGERLETGGHVEISAVCTNPQFTGRGYAALLLGVLANDIFARGATPFLHVGDHNQRAIDLYARLGFRESARLGMWKVRRGA